MLSNSQVQFYCGYLEADLQLWSDEGLSHVLLLQTRRLKTHRFI